MAAHHDIVGVVLAGGQSRRMGGGDKGLLELGDKPMLGHVLARLTPQVARVAINANGPPERFAAFGVPVVADSIGGFAGPLAGVLAGMRWAAQEAPTARWIATTSADAPFIPMDLVARLRAAAVSRPKAIAIAESSGDLHPVIGLWPVAHAVDLEAELNAGIRKVLRWTDKHGTIPVPFEVAKAGGTEIDPFFNANTPGELDEARRLLQKSAP
jgi:molybdenum cofactor guanylyltransferase